MTAMGSKPGLFSGPIPLQVQYIYRSKSMEEPSQSPGIRRRSGVSYGFCISMTLFVALVLGMSGYLMSGKTLSMIGIAAAPIIVVVAVSAMKWFDKVWDWTGLVNQREAHRFQRRMLRDSDDE